MKSNMAISKRILVVDDEPNLLVAVAATLRGEGYETATARNGKEAILRIAENIPDLIVSDIRMPVMDGYALSRQLRAAPHTSLIPIVFLTAKDDMSDRITGLRAGVDAYLTKPFEPEELLAIISNILQRIERTHTQIIKLAGSFTEAPPAERVYSEELTDAELKIAKAVSTGSSNKQIAAELDISIRTVENHISRILSKLALSNRVEITRYILGRELPE